MQVIACPTVILTHVCASLRGVAGEPGLLLAADSEKGWRKTVPPYVSHNQLQGMLSLSIAACNLLHVHCMYMGPLFHCMLCAQFNVHVVGDFLEHYTNLLPACSLWQDSQRYLQGWAIGPMVPPMCCCAKACEEPLQTAHLQVLPAVHVDVAALWMCLTFTNRRLVGY